MLKNNPPRSARRWPSGVAAFLLIAFWLSSACGYRVAGRGSQLPAGWKTIAVPALQNKTTRYRLEQRLTEALVRELITRTAYRVIQDEAAADATLTGEVFAVEASPVLFDAATGRATTMVVTVRVKVRLADRATRKVHFQNDDFVFRQQYEVSGDINSFFEEQEPALGRLARDFAARLVSALLENF